MLHRHRLERHQRVTGRHPGPRIDVHGRDRPEALARLAAALDETVVLGYTVEDDTGMPCPGYYRLFRAPSGPFLLQCQLPPDNLPARMVQEVRSSDALPPSLSRELYCDRGGVVSAYYPGMEPGMAGIALEWE